MGDDGEEDGCIVVGTRVGFLDDGDRVAAVGLSECGRLVGPGEKGLGKCVPLGKRLVQRSGRVEKLELELDFS